MRAVSRNLAINVTGAVLPVLTALITVPITLHLIGAGRYGIVSISWILLGYFGFLDFGLSRASTNALGRLGAAGPEVRGPVLVTAFWLNAGLGLAGGLILYASGDFLLRHAFDISGPLRDETLAAFPWMVPMLPLGMVLGVASGALESRERFVTSNILNVSGTVLGQALPLLCALFVSRSLTVLIPSILFARLAVVLASFAVVWRLEGPIAPLRVHRAWVRRLFGYGAWVTVSSLISPLLDGFDQILIGRLLGPVAIAHYAVPMNLAMRSQVLATALARTLFPALSRSDGAGARQIAARATLGLLYAFGAICGGAILVCAPFLRLWVGADFAREAAPVAQILVLGAWANGVGFMPYNQLQAQGRPDLTAKLHAAEIVPFVAGLFLLIRLDGLPGAAVAWTLRTGIDCVALLAMARCLEGSVWRAMPAALLMGLCLLLAALVPMGLPMALATGSVAGLAFLACGLAAEPALRNLLPGLRPARLVKS